MLRTRKHKKNRFNSRKNKSYKKYKLHNRRKSNNKRKPNNKRKTVKFGGSENKVMCSICERLVNKNNTLVPNECLIKNGISAHRICQDCWWDPQKGFALETSSHRCPGCLKNLPLNAVKNEPPIEIDLSDD